MTHQIEQKLQELGITLPEPSAAAANYRPYVVHDNLVYISGQLPVKDGKIAYEGKIGKDMSLQDGVEAAKLCAINILAQLKQACGNDFNRVDRCLKLGGFVNAATDFTQHPQVINGASNLLGEVMGAAGEHARFAMGAGSLPLNVSVEIEAVFALK